MEIPIEILAPVAVTLTGALGWMGKALLQKTTEHATALELRDTKHETALKNQRVELLGIVDGLQKEVARLNDARLEDSRKSGDQMLNVATKSTELVEKNLQSLNGVAQALEDLSREMQRAPR